VKFSGLLLLLLFLVCLLNSAVWLISQSVKRSHNVAKILTQINSGLIPDILIKNDLRINSYIFENLNFSKSTSYYKKYILIVLLYINKCHDL